MSTMTANTQDCSSDAPAQTINLSAIPLKQPPVLTVSQTPLPSADVIPSSADVSTFNPFGD